MSSIDKELEELKLKHDKEMEEFRSAAGKANEICEAHRAAIEKQYGKMSLAPQSQRNAYKETLKMHDIQWGHDGVELNTIVNRQKQEKEKVEEKKLTPYDRIVKKHAKEIQDYKSNAYNNWVPHEEMHKALEKEYGGWDKVPEHHKVVYAQKVKEYDVEWLQDGNQMTEMLKWQKEELAEQIKKEAQELKRRWQESKDRSRGR
ncbi:MAG: hypothetical protein V4561_10090 [Bacteroidota bacterium]